MISPPRFSISAMPSTIYRGLAHGVRVPGIPCNVHGARIRTVGIGRSRPVPGPVRRLYDEGHLVARRHFRDAYGGLLVNQTVLRFDR
jgi:hypothetical protein